MRSMASNLNRLRKELKDMQSSNSSSIKVDSVDENNMLRWTLLILPDAAPYNKGAFKVTVEFPPNIRSSLRFSDSRRRSTIRITEHWKPATRTQQVIETLLALIAEPELSHPLRADLAEEYEKNKANFLKAAEEHTKTHAEKRK
uniref:UBC core domain-containing protein n=1 Tax=Ditylenchus dipsaci TaxID=166011 RepID=A0A915EPJ6_9BILA